MLRTNRDAKPPRAFNLVLRVMNSHQAHGPRVPFDSQKMFADHNFPFLPLGLAGDGFGLRELRHRRNFGSHKQIHLLAHIYRTILRTLEAVDDLEHARIDTLGARTGERSLRNHEGLDAFEVPLDT